MRNCFGVYLDVVALYGIRLWICVRTDSLIAWASGNIVGNCCILLGHYRIVALWLIRRTVVNNHGRIGNDSRALDWHPGRRVG